MLQWNERKQLLPGGRENPPRNQEHKQWIRWSMQNISFLINELNMAEQWCAEQLFTWPRRRWASRGRSWRKGFVLPGQGCLYQPLLMTCCWGAGRGWGGCRHCSGGIWTNLAHIGVRVVWDAIFEGEAVTYLIRVRWKRGEGAERIPGGAGLRTLSSQLRSSLGVAKPQGGT